MAKFTRMEWSIRQIRYWLDRNKVGLLLGALLGLGIFLVQWYKYSIPMLEWLVYQFTLIFGCTIPFWSIILFVLFYSLLGACSDSFISKPKDDKKRALIILVILSLIFIALYFYRAPIVCGGGDISFTVDITTA